MVDKGNDRVRMSSPVGEDQRRVVELVLDEDVQILESDSLLLEFPGVRSWPPKPEPKVIRQMRGVIPPREGNDLHRIPLSTQVLDHSTVVQVAAAACFQRTIDDKANLHLSNVEGRKSKLPGRKSDVDPLTLDPKGSPGGFVLP